MPPKLLVFVLLLLHRLAMGDISATSKTIISNLYPNEISATELAQIEADVETGALVKEFTKLNPTAPPLKGQVKVNISFENLKIDDAKSLSIRFSCEGIEKKWADVYSDRVNAFVDLRVMGFSTAYSMQKVLSSLANTTLSKEVSEIQARYPFVDANKITFKSSAKRGSTNVVTYELKDDNITWTFEATVEVDGKISQVNGEFSRER